MFSTKEIRPNANLISPRHPLLQNGKLAQGVVESSILFSVESNIQTQV